jgi:hypothetical protein
MHLNGFADQLKNKNASYLPQIRKLIIAVSVTYRTYPGLGLYIVLRLTPLHPVNGSWLRRSVKAAAAALLSALFSLIFARALFFATGCLADE